MEELDPVEQLLAQKLNTANGFTLADQLTEIEAWGARVAKLHRDAEKHLSELKKRYLLPKSREYTDMDRTIDLEASVAPEQRTADYLSDLQQKIERRISLGQTLLKNVITELNSGLRIN